jgi:two-component system phosphate regulon response regulator PhoB
VLIVEDDRLVAEMLIMLLETEGYRVTWLNNAAAVLDLFSRDNGTTANGQSHTGKEPKSHSSYPDIILLDLLLPDINGVELMQRIMQISPRLPPVILISATAQQEIEQAAFDMHVADIVRKPFDITTLLESISAVLAERVR